MRRPSAASLKRYADEFNRSATMRHFGVKVRFPKGEEVLVMLDPIRPEQRGGLGSDAVNGGVLAALFDLAIGCTPALIDPTRRTATVELSMHFMRAVRGSKLTVRGRIDRATSALVFSSATVYDAEGNECSIAHGIARISSTTWAGGGSPAVN